MTKRTTGFIPAIDRGRANYHLMGQKGGKKCCNWRVSRPCQATNYVKRPSFENWTIAETASTITTSNVEISVASSKLATNSSYVNHGTQSLFVKEDNFLLTPYGATFRWLELETETQYVFSFDVLVNKGTEERTISVTITSGDGLRQLNQYGGTLKRGWNRIYLPFATEVASAVIKTTIKVQKVTGDLGFYLDGLMITKGTGKHIYFDGDSGGTWQGTPHDSYSVRDIFQPGGELVDLCSLGFWPLAYQTIGLPEFDLGETEYALQGGAISNRTRIKTRGFALLGRIYGDQYEIHKTRQKIIEMLTPPNSQNRSIPTVLRYQVLDDCCGEFGCELEIQAVFEGEADYSMDNVDQADIALRFRELEAPNVYEAGFRRSYLTYRNDDGGSPPATVSDYFIRQSTGGWIVRSEGVFSSVTRSTAVIPSPTVVGDAWFGSQGNSPNVFTAGVNSAVNYGVSGVLAMTDVYDIATAANGKVWFVGTGAAKLWYRDSAGATTDRSSAFTTPTKVAISQNFIYVGATNQSGGIVRRSGNDGASWVSLAAVATGEVRCMAVQPDGKVVVVGSFTQTTNINKTAVNAMRYNPRTFAWEAICTSADATIDACAVGPDGKVYLGGKFTTLNGVAVNQVAAWNGTQISALGAGVGAPATFDAADSKSIKALAVASDGTLWCGGRFDTAGTVAAINLAKWQGGAWTPSDLSFNNRPVNDLAFDKLGNLFVAATVSGGADVPDTEGITDICYCGSADEKPVITFYGPGTLKSLKHLVTGDKIEFDYTMADGEIMTLDLRRNDSEIFVSNVNGNQLRAIRPGSNYDTFALISSPDECNDCPNNQIALLIEGATSGTTKAIIEWRNRHWTIDAAATCGRCGSYSMS